MSTDPKQLAQQIEQWREDNRIETTLAGQPMRFLTTWGLFSPREIDSGSWLLLKQFEDGQIELNPSDDILDLGCGYGPLGLTLARLAPQGKTLLVDKDFVAVEYTKKNIEINRIQNAEAMLSNGLAHIPKDRRFDAIVSNVPAKVGKEMLYIMLDDAHARLKPGGRIVLVTISGLREFFKRTLVEMFGNYDKVKQGKDYTVSLAIKQK
ncbi:MAG: class I SAM-dependent methyltransferase [Halothiobacillaceae bacterium]